MCSYIDILKQKKQIILQGAPGTGKTYSTAQIAVELINRNVTNGREQLMAEYRKLMEDKRIYFTTFHQSMDYEEFVEGYKPVENGGFEEKSGIFKKACDEARNLYNRSLIQDQKLKTSTIEEALEKFYEDLRNTNTNDREKDTGQLTLKTKSGIEFYTYLNDNNTLYVRSSTQNQNEIRWYAEKIENYYHSKKNNGIAAYAYPIIEYLKEKYNLISKEELDKLQKNQVDTPSNAVVLIIDEINRGNISKILGELITLLETDKREGQENEIKITLPYSQDIFCVPPNLYIVGTMNTADRSIGHIDYALRRRFAFITLMADENMISEIAKPLFNKVQELIKNNINSEFEADDLMIGHSYFMTNKEEELKIKLDYEIRPLLLEYLKDGILNYNNDLKEKIRNLSIYENIGE